MIPGTDLFAKHFPLLGPFFVPPTLVSPFAKVRRYGETIPPLERQESFERLEDRWFDKSCKQVANLARLIRRRERCVTMQLLNEFLGLSSAGYLPVRNRCGSLTYKVVKILAANLCDKRTLQILLTTLEVQVARSRIALVEKRLTDLDHAEAAA